MPVAVKATAWLELSQFSASQVLPTPIFPFNAPHRNLVVSAHENVLLNPNIMISMAADPHPMINAGRLPYLSANLPHAIEDTSWPAW
jgi:hypothetical protein